MAKIRSKYKKYGAGLGMIILVLTIVIGGLIATHSKKEKVHLNIKMAINVLCCISIGIVILYLTWNVFVKVYFSESIGIALFVLILYKLILIVNMISDGWLLLPIGLNMLLIFMFMVVTTKFYEVWKEWYREKQEMELNIWLQIHGKRISPKDVQNFRIPLTGELPTSSIDLPQVADVDTDSNLSFNWELDFIDLKENKTFSWGLYSNSSNWSLDTLYSKVLEEYYGIEFKRKRSTVITYESINKELSETSVNTTTEHNTTDEDVKEETVREIINPTYTDEEDESESESK